MTRPVVLFVCVHNAGRSQLAAGLAAHHAGAGIEVLSAGTEPDQQVDPVALASLAELGIDRSDQTPTPLTEDLLDRADVVVTLKPGLDLPHRSGVRYENWPLPDPQGWDLDGIRSLRDHLDGRVHQLLADLNHPDLNHPDPSHPDPSHPDPSHSDEAAHTSKPPASALGPALTPAGVTPAPLNEEIR
jgi:protein-tyrosine-phosphatase